MTFAGIAKYTGQFVDPDLGYAYDDHVGYDSTFRMGFAYNDKDTDGHGEPHTYDTQIPMAGVTMIRLPNDNGNILSKMKSFVSYNNNSTVIGNPNNGTGYYNYLNGTALDCEMLFTAYLDGQLLKAQGKLVKQ